MFMDTSEGTQATQKATSKPKFHSIHNIKTNVSEVELIKKKLKEYSTYLRRDFLYVLVKATSRQFSVHTSREDWRTRTGMLQFLARSWIRISTVIDDQSYFIGWYCHNFEKAECFLTCKKFALFLENQWNHYKAFLVNSQTVEFLEVYKRTLTDILKSGNNNIEKCINSEILHHFVQIIQTFKSNADPSDNDEYFGPSTEELPAVFPQEEEYHSKEVVSEQAVSNQEESPSFQSVDNEFAFLLEEDNLIFNEEDNFNCDDAMCISF